jgi:membrane protein DedA with SNARE-associated domain
MTSSATLAAISAAAVTASTIGNALLAGLLPTRPELLLVLSPGNLVLLLVAHRVSFTTYYVLGLSRMVISDLAPFLLGYLHGRRGVNLVVRKDRHRELINDRTTQLRPIALVALFVSASAVVSALAGFSRVRPWMFVVLDVAGSTVRLVLLWYVAGLFSDQLDAVAELIEEWQAYLLAAGVAVTGLLSWWRHRRRARRPA